MSNFEGGIMGWQPIETVKKYTVDSKDYGYEYILTDGWDVGTGFWNDCLGLWDWAYKNNYLDKPKPPTHWMLFPEVPE